MTRLLLLFFLALSLNTFSQTPQGINYQAVAHDNTGATLNNQAISVRIGIISSSISGPLEWEETHAVTTNSYGLFDLVIGQGTSTGTGNQTAFANITWSTASHFMKVEVDAGTGYENLGTSQLLAVPYALHAKTVEVDAVDDADADATNELITGGTLNGTDLEITDAGGTTTVDLSPLAGGSGDDWGTQVAVTDATMSGDGTAASPLSANGDNWGTQTAVTDATLSGDGTAATPLTVVGDLTDDQTLTYNSGLQTLDISGGNQVTLDVNDADADATNELLTGGTMNGTDLELTDAGGITTIDMSSLATSDTLPVIKNAGNNTYVSAVSNTEIEMGFGGAAYYVLDDQNRLSIPQNNGNLFIGPSPGGTAVTTGDQNFGFGNGALGNVTSGIFNTAIAPVTLNSLTTGNENVAIGRGALSSTTDGGGNVALGYFALGAAGAGANDNVAIGYDAGANWTGGYQNVFLGYRAGAMVGAGSGNNNIKIGANAGTNDNGNNKLYIGTHDGTTSLIYGNMSSDSLRINGSLSIANEYTFPLTDGNPGDILSTDGLGQASWISAGGGGWTTTGNAGTVDGTNFIGTTDNIPLNFRVNNINAGKIDQLLVNAFFGYRAGNSITTGSNNTAMGTDALYSNTTGLSNTAIGQHALYNNTGGNYNIANGIYVMYSNTTGSDNNAVGRDAMYLNSSGNGNIALGYQALFQNTTGDNNMALGTLSGTTLGMGNLTNANAIGYNAKVATSNSMVLGGTGTDAVNVGIGTDSPAEVLHVVGGSVLIDDGANPYTLPFSDATTANHVMTSDAAGTLTWVDPSTLLGFPNELRDTDNDTRIEVEQVADQDIIHFSLGDATGYTAQEYFRMVGPRLDVINPSFSVFIGEEAGANDDLTSNQGVFIGYFAGNANTTGQSNVGVGMLALGSNTTGGGNTAVGGNTLGANVSGTGNTAIGFSSQQATTGGQNTSVGNGSMNANTTGTDNTAMGAFSLSSNTGGVNNTAIGRQSFSNSLANENTGLGAYSGQNTTTGAGNTFVGLSAGLSNTTGSDNVVVGNNAGSGNLTGSNIVLLGHGTSTSADGFTNSAAIGSNAQVGASNSMVLGGTGANAVNVGIGTTTPQSKLHVETDGTLIGGARLVDQSSTSVGAALYFDAFSQDWGIYASNSGATAGGDKLIFRNYTGANDALVINSSNNVGIGTVNPGEKLTVSNGNILLNGGHHRTTGAAVSSIDGPNCTNSFVSGNDVAGYMGCDAFFSGNTMTVVFTQPYVTPPVVNLTPRNANAAQSEFFVVTSTTGFTLELTANPNSGATLEWNYMVIEH